MDGLAGGELAHVPGEVAVAEAVRAGFDPGRHPRDARGRFSRVRTPSPAETARLMDAARAGGFTYHVVSHTSPAVGFALSPYPERSKVIDTADLTGDTVREYIAANAGLLAKPDHYLGAWRERNDVDRVWLDVAIVTSDRRRAEDLGREHNQIAAFDLATGQEVPLGGTGEASRATRGQGPRLDRFLARADGLDADLFVQRIKHS